MPPEWQAPATSAAPVCYETFSPLITVNLIGTSELIVMLTSAGVGLGSGGGSGRIGASINFQSTIPMPSIPIALAAAGVRSIPAAFDGTRPAFGPDPAGNGVPAR